MALARPMLTVTEPSDGASEKTPFSAKGTCTNSGDHTLTVKLTPGDYGAGSITWDGTTWTASFDNIPAGTYTLKAACGDTELPVSITVE